MGNFSSTMIGATLLALVLGMAGGCGSSSSTNTNGNPNVFYASSMTFRNNSTVAWGYNGFGQLSDGTTTSHTDPRTRALIGVNGVSVGGFHTLAFGTYTAWTTGGNSLGQLGRVTASTVTQETLFQPVNFQLYSSVAGKPATSPWHKKIIAAVAGGNHNLLANETGEVWSWGENNAGQLGNGSFAGATNTGILISLVRDESDTPLKLSASPLTAVEQSLLAAGTYHSLALLKGSATVYAWGVNNRGQLGIPGFTTLSKAKAISFPGFDATQILKVAAGGGMSAALDNNKNVWIWGVKGIGQADLLVPTKVAGLTDVTDISVGSVHVLALKGDGTVWAWGFNGFGQLGDNTKTDQFDPKQVPGLSGVTEIRAFGNQSFAKSGTTWYAWGDNTQGQLGYDTPGLTYSLVPKAVPGL